MRPHRHDHPGAARVRDRRWLRSAGDAHQVELSVLEIDGVAEMFLKDGDVVVGRRDRSQWLERRTLDLSSIETYTRIRIDKSDSRAEAVAYPVSARCPVRFIPISRPAKQRQEVD